MTASRTIRFPLVLDYVHIQLAATPLAAVVDVSQDDLVAALVDDVARALAPYGASDALAFPQEVHVLLARQRQPARRRRRHQR